MGSRLSDGPAGGFAFVTAEIVEDDHVTAGERGDQDFLHIEGEELSIDRPIDDAGSIDAVDPKRRDEGERFPMIVGNAGLEALAARSPAAQRRHVGLHPCFIDEDEPQWVDTGLMCLPAFPLAGDVRTRLFGRYHGFF